MCIVSLFQKRIKNKTEREGERMINQLKKTTVDKDTKAKKETMKLAWFSCGPQTWRCPNLQVPSTFRTNPTLDGNKHTKVNVESHIKSGGRADYKQLVCWLYLDAHAIFMI